MLFGSILSDLFGEACLWSIFVIWFIGWLLCKAGEALNNSPFSISVWWDNE
jgi:hypothetical protein